jgi:hypothetical protein
MHLNGKKPYFQGYLDGLCAVYCIVNATRIINNISEEEARKLFQQILKYLEDNNLLINAILNGITLVTIGSILKDIATLERTMPFKHNPNTTLDEFWAETTSFLSIEKRAVLIALGGKAWDHWSIINTITDTRINFFDSHRLRRFNRSRCTTIKPTKTRPHLLCTTHVYFLSNHSLSSSISVE